jgi:hypothetical protein
MKQYRVWTTRDELTQVYRFEEGEGWEFESFDGEDGDIEVSLVTVEEEHAARFERLFDMDGAISKWEEVE